ncbi:MAG: hypothetical protein COB20_10220 [SAR86 cluster bacterium]|uniref:Uncharacterized protein n=1 Tax=SAR86 cluster bacterium TaxID=2030880 RepID=A0A2A4X1U4_9GAMM|nr:MAG: hypothetical protein COB20_10220 [SAR86 cluster bacterium]
MFAALDMLEYSSMYRLVPAFRFKAISKLLRNYGTGAETISAETSAKSRKQGRLEKRYYWRRESLNAKIGYRFVVYRRFRTIQERVNTNEHS